MTSLLSTFSSCFNYSNSGDSSINVNSSTSSTNVIAINYSAVHFMCFGRCINVRRMPTGFVGGLSSKWFTGVSPGGSGTSAPRCFFSGPSSCRASTLSRTSSTGSASFKWKDVNSTGNYTSGEDQGLVFPATSLKRRPGAACGTSHPLRSSFATV